MKQTSTVAEGNEEFEVRVRQAIQSAMFSTSQVAVLLIKLYDAIHPHESVSLTSVSIQNSFLLRITSGLRESDLVSLLGNGQIGVLLRPVQHPQDINLVINRLLTQQIEPAQTNDESIALVPRIGIAVFPDHSGTASDLLDRARNDLALAIAADKTHNPYVPQFKGRIASRLWLKELRRAIVKDQLFLTFQPKVNLRRPQVTGFEALVRWQHPEYGLILPDQFIPFAERTGLIIPMTLWVLQQALAQCRAWNEIDIDLSIAVNLSMWNLEAQELPEQIEALLRDSGVAPRNLQLEITESSIMNDPQRVIRTLHKIRDLGVSFAIDDFGTGYSSFAYLTKLPVSCIKIDKSFVQHIESDRDSSVVIKSIIDLGHNLGMKVVAEGVENAQSMELLRSFQCDEAQGYYLCRPVTADMATKFLLESQIAGSEQQTMIGENWQPANPPH